MKIRLTRSMLDELWFSEVEVYDADPYGAGPGKAEFVEAIRPACVAPIQSAVVNLEGVALVYAGHPQWGAFATRADILSDWGPEFGSLSRAFERRANEAWAEAQAVLEAEFAPEPQTDEEHDAEFALGSGGNPA